MFISNWFSLNKVPFIFKNNFNFCFVTYFMCVCAGGKEGGQRGIRLPVTEVTGVCQLPDVWGLWELNLALLQEWLVFLTTEVPHFKYKQTNKQKRTEHERLGSKNVMVV